MLKPELVVMLTLGGRPPCVVVGSFASGM